MPWTPSDAKSHTRAAEGGAAARQWAHVANSVRDKALASGATEEEADARAVREANAVAAGRRPATHAHPSRSAPTPHTHDRPR